MDTTVEALEIQEAVALAATAHFTQTRRSNRLSRQHHPRNVGATGQIVIDSSNRPHDHDHGMRALIGDTRAREMIAPETVYGHQIAVIVT